MSTLMSAGICLFLNCQDRLFDYFYHWLWLGQH